jgi:hypothetical protein
MTPKQIPIDFRQNASKFVSMQGANNVIQLVVPLPREMQAIQSGKLAFRKDEQDSDTYATLFTTDSTQPAFVENGTLYVTVWRELTLCSSLRLQVFGSLPGGGVLPSPLSRAMVFDRSIIYDSGTQAPPNILEDLIAKSHWHENKSQLDDIDNPITESDILEILNN